MRRSAIPALVVVVLVAALVLHRARQDRTASSVSAASPATAGRMPSAVAPATTPRPPPPGKPAPAAVTTTSPQAPRPQHDPEAETTPTPDTDAPSSVWPRDPSGIVDAIAERFGTLHDCYETVLQLHPDVAGGITVRFTIAPDGSLDEVGVVETTTEHLLLEGCVLTVVEELRFEPGEEPLAVSYPLAFSK